MQNVNYTPGTLTYADEAVNFLVGVLSLYSFEKEQIFVSFNGGKDATIVLYLTYFALQQTNTETKIRCLYFVEKDPFPEVDSFMQQQIQKLDLIMHPIVENAKVGLAKLKESTQINAVIMGTRKTDPHGEKLEKITVTDSGYPPMLRVNPILYWNYEQVWEFIRTFNIPYCELYNKGFTYLGNHQNTIPNQKLQTESGNFRPAWEAAGETEYLSRKELIKNGDL